MLLHLNRIFTKSTTHPDRRPAGLCPLFTYRITKGMYPWLNKCRPLSNYVFALIPLFVWILIHSGLTEPVCGDDFSLYILYSYRCNECESKYVFMLAWRDITVTNILTCGDDTGMGRGWREFSIDLVNYNVTSPWLFQCCHGFHS